ncbi:hypothetical protein BKA63DRAFT_553981 [Paraphoma chrysanthemicola]|nr:hypothetical protein BKA63DRAFT_553981 [Paraphoma chrysanthemicola]
MRLLQFRSNGELSLVSQRPDGDHLAYAILSHTWGPDGDEVTFRDIQYGTGKAKPGYFKILWCGQQAKKDGLHYFWVDTCCIDKSSSQELQESINSMYRWYQHAERCYVYLNDVSGHAAANADDQAIRRWEPDFRRSRWFTRGWTLQELIAPLTVDFFTREGTHLGSKLALETTIQDITGIDLAALNGQRLLSDFSIDERFSWAKDRVTSREEDTAYCLFGIFDVQIPLIYAEGREKAMKRLRKEIREQQVADVERLIDDKKQIRLQQRREHLIRLLRFDQIDVRRMVVGNAHSNTCRWLLGDTCFIKWFFRQHVHQDHGLLWIKGKPGSGKSTLMKFAYEHARKTLINATVISFFFNARGGALEKSTIGMYRSILLQLFEGHPALQTVLDPGGLIEGSEEGEFPGNFQWTLQNLQALIGNALLQDLKTFAVVAFIDALDECDESLVREMVYFFEDICKQALSRDIHFQVCFASRHYPHITITNGRSLILEDRNGQDICNYIYSELRIGHSFLADSIRQEIQEKAAGIFMWAVLVVRILNKEHDSGRTHALRKRVQEIPSDLHDLFRDILMRDISSHQREVLELCIQWVLCATSPLSPKILYFAILMGTEPDVAVISDRGDITAEVMERFILNSSKGLLEITPNPHRRVQFIHESVRDFLLEDGLSTIWPEVGQNFHGQSHERLKEFCMRNISATEVAHEIKQSSVLSQENRYRRAITLFPLLEYSTRAILFHAEAAAKLGIDQSQFLDMLPLRFMIQLVNHLLVANYDDRIPLSLSLPYLLAEYNFSTLLECCGTSQSCLEVGDGRFGPPLFAAMAMKSYNAFNVIIKILPKVQGNSYIREDEIGRQDQNSDQRWSLGKEFKYHKSRNIPSYVAEMGNHELMSLLLRIGKVDVDSKDEALNQQTLLSVAAGEGHHEVMNVLLEAGAGIDNRDTFGRTPLWYAIRHGNKRAVALLLDYGANINSKDNSGSTSLLWAAEHSSEAMLRLLLETGKSDVEMTNLGGETPLLIASQCGYVGSVKLLLYIGKARTDVRDRIGQSALWWAIENQHVEVIKLLLSTVCTQFTCPQAFSGIDNRTRPPRISFEYRRPNTETSRISLFPYQGVDPISYSPALDHHTTGRLEHRGPRQCREASTRSRIHVGSSIKTCDCTRPCAQLTFDNQGTALNDIEPSTLAANPTRCHVHQDRDSSVDRSTKAACSPQGIDTALAPERLYTTYGSCRIPPLDESSTVAEETEQHVPAPADKFEEVMRSFDNHNGANTDGDDEFSRYQRLLSNGPLETADLSQILLAEPVQAVVSRPRRTPPSYNERLRIHRARRCAIFASTPSNPYRVYPQIPPTPLQFEHNHAFYSSSLYNKEYRSARCSICTMACEASPTIVRDVGSFCTRKIWYRS